MTELFKKLKANSPGDRKRRGLSGVSVSFLENSTLLKKFLTRFLGQRQDIEDVVQEAYLRAYDAEKSHEIDQPKAFLFRIARNIALNELKKKSRVLTDYVEHYDEPDIKNNSPTLEDELEAQEHIGLYCEAFASLPEQRRRVCLLRKVHGLQHKEIAARLDLSVSSVEKHLLRGALACQEYILEREQGGGKAILGSGTLLPMKVYVGAGKNTDKEVQ